MLWEHLVISAYKLNSNPWSETERGDTSTLPRKLQDNELSLSANIEQP